jgi:hypothetical protein
MRAWVHTEGWAGRLKSEVEILGATPKRYRVRVVEPWRLKGRRFFSVGQVVLVPKTAVRNEEGGTVVYPPA